ncbi:MAG: UbiD family decarboxylase [Acidobacteria bacterium]|nr:UbiD family decarboxylase [Acidobacteriota bacterium]
MAYRDLREYLKVLDERGKLHHVKKEVDPEWEVAAVMRRVFQRIPPDQRPAVMFERIKGHGMPLVAGVLGASPEVYALALETTVDQIADKWSRAQTNPIPPVRVKAGPVKDNIVKDDRVDVSQLPLCVWTRGQDPAPYVTGPCVVSRDPETGERNMGTYRLMLKGKRRFGIYFTNTWRHMYVHVMKNEKQGRPTPCAVVLGCDPTVPLTSVARVQGDEYGVAGGLRGIPLEVVKCETSDLEVPAHAEIVIEGVVPCGVREPEGPFGEYTGYMGAAAPSFVIDVTCVTHRSNPVYQAFFSQMPPSESSCIRGTGRDVAFYKHMARDLKLPVRDVHLLEAGGGAAFLAISLRRDHPGLPHRAMWAAWAYEPSLSKFVVVVDEDIDIRDHFQLLWAMSWHVQPDQDIHIYRNTAATALDPSLAQEHDGEFERADILSSKVGIDATRKHKFPARSIPPKEDLDKIDADWNEYGFQSSLTQRSKE